MKTKLTMPVLVACACVAATALTGCKSTPDTTSHIWQIGGTGTKAGIVQDPITGMYSVGLQRVQIVNTIIPCRVITNSAGEQKFITPDVNASYEVSGHNAIFGNVGLTETLATGTNAVATILGGNHQPINANVGTGAQTPTALPGPASWSTTNVVTNKNAGEAP